VSNLYSLNYVCLTVASYLSAIGYAHKLGGVNEPTEISVIRQILRGYRKLATSHDVRLPVTLQRGLTCKRDKASALALSTLAT